MDRKIKFADVEAAVAEAYESVKTINEGAIDARVAGENAGKFGVAVTLADGRTIVRGDVDAAFVMGSLSKVPMSAVLLSQFGPDGVLQKSGRCCSCQQGPKPDIVLSAHGVRAVSAVEPQNDEDGKWTVLMDMVTGMIGSAPVFDDRAYEAQKKMNAADDVENKIAAAQWYLWDDAPIAIDAYTKLQSMAVTTRQLAMMGATIAADGVCPATGVPAYDGVLSQYILGMMASHGPHKMNQPWIIRTGLPAKTGFGGGMVAVLPGVMAIAAYSPELNANGVSVKAPRAIKAIAEKLDINAFASAKVTVE